MSISKNVCEKSFFGFSPSLFLILIFFSKLFQALFFFLLVIQHSGCPMAIFGPLARGQFYSLEVVTDVANDRGLKLIGNLKVK